MDEKSYWFNRLDRLNLGEYSDAYDLDKDALINLVRELETANKAAELNLETNAGMENLERIWNKYIYPETEKGKDKTMENFTVISEADRKIRSYRLKSMHMNYIEDYITEFDYREVLWLTINKIRKSLNLKEFSESEFDRAWQYRTMAHETWKIARNEILSTILGVW